MLPHPQPTAPYRAIAILTAKPGSEDALREFTLSAAQRIRAVSGLVKLEISQAMNDPGRLVLYYWWVSPAHSAAYVSGPVYAAIMPTLKSLIADHVLIMALNIDDGEDRA
jgi:quinol monooxygenase YgiN